MASMPKLKWKLKAVQLHIHTEQQKVQQVHDEGYGLDARMNVAFYIQY